jgi:hypothetical protein
MAGFYHVRGGARQGILPFATLRSAKNMLSEEQFAEMARWLRDIEGIEPAEDEIVATQKTLEYYIDCWGDPHESKVLDSGAGLSIWRGEGYAFWIADFGEVRAAAVF